MRKPVAIALVLLVATSFRRAARSPTRTAHQSRGAVPARADRPTPSPAVVTQSLRPALGQSIVIENQSGAGGGIALKQVARAEPDGYTLLLGGTNNNSITPALYKDLDFDAVNDFAPAATIGVDRLCVVIHPSVPAKTMAELVAYAKANPGKLSSGGGVGISPHFLLEFIRVKSGANIVFVPYKGAAPGADRCAGRANPDALHREVGAVAAHPGRQAPRARGRRRQALARIADVPTLDRSGLRQLPAGDLVRLPCTGENAARRHRQVQRGGSAGAEDRAGEERPSPSSASTRASSARRSSARCWRRSASSGPRWRSRRASSWRRIRCSLDEVLQQRQRDSLSPLGRGWGEGA